MFDLEKRIKGYMSDYRYAHTVSVAKECAALASLFAINSQHLVTAAYLHDITKEMPVDKQIKLCFDMEITIDKDTLNSPKTLHSFTAPALIKRDFPEYAHPDILSAVRYHTTGHAGMTLNEKLLYLADYIEPTRKFEDCKTIRNYFYADTSDPQKRLDKAIILSLKYTVSDLIEKGDFIHPETISAYNALLKQIGE